MDDIVDYIAFMICISTLAANLILNVGILIAPIIDGALRRKRFAVLTSLAVADLLKIIPLISEIGSSSYQQRTCQAVASVGLYLICVTILHLVLESINRLVAIVRPLRYGELLTNKLLVSLLAMLWFLPILGIILPLAVYSKVSDWVPSVRFMMFNCDQFHDRPERDNVTEQLAGFDGPTAQFEPASDSIIVYSAIITIVYFAIPLIIMVLAYSIIFHISLKHIRQIKSMEKNMRHLYHRISRSNLVSKNISEISTSTQVYECEIQSTKYYEISGKPGTIDEIPSHENNNTEDPIYPMDNDNYEGISNGLNDREVNRKEPTVLNIEKNGIKNTGRTIKKAVVAFDDGTSKEANYKKNNRRRNARNAVYPLNKSTKIGRNDDETVEQFKGRYTNLSADLSYINCSSEEVTQGNGGVTEAFTDASKTRWHRVKPVQAEDIMASEYDPVVKDILDTDIGTDVDTKSKVKTLDDASILGLPTSGATDEDSAVCIKAQIVDASGDVLREDPGENENNNTRKTKVNFPLNSVHEGPFGTERNKAWQKLWQKIPKNSKRRDENEEMIPSESAFIKIIEAVENKSIPSQHSFEENAKRVMRFSTIFKSRQKVHSMEEGEDTEERPTHAEVNHMESLLSIAESRHNDQVARALNKTIKKCGSESQDIDTFSLLTAFPVMEVWANSLKAKAAPQSNSFVRFYRVIRGEMRNRKKEGKLVKTLGLLFMTWILFYIPVVAFSWSRLMRWPSLDNDHGGSRLFISWALLSSAFNPIIYCLRIPEFKKTFRKLYKTIKSHIYCR